MSDLPEIGASLSITLGTTSVTSTLKTFDNLPDNHPYFSKIGRITARWAQFENLVDVMIWDAMGIDQETASLETANISGHVPRFTKLREKLAAKGIGVPAFADVGALEAKATTVALRRHRVTHDPWFMDSAGIAYQQTSQSAKKGLSFEFKPVSDQSLEDLNQEIVDLIGDASALRAKLLS